MNTIFDPARLFAYGISQSQWGTDATGRGRMVRACCRIFGVSAATINKWASPNECSYRRNPIESCGEIFTLFFSHSRAAAFMVKDYFHELEMRLLEQHTTTLRPFNPREAIRDMRQLLRMLEDLEERQADTAAYVDVLAEAQALGSTHTERILRAAAGGAPPPSIVTVPADGQSRRLVYNPRTPEAYR